MVDEPYRGSNLGPLSKLKTLTEDYIDPLTGANYGATNEDRPKLRHMIEPDLTQIQTGKYDIPENVYIDPLGVPRNKDDGQKIEIIRRPNVLPFVNTPQGVELAMPKIVDVVGNIMGGVVAPVKGAGTVLGAGPVLKAGEKAIEAATEVKPFYSALENQVNTINQAKMTGEQWLGTLGNKAGVKPEEMQYTGLNDFLTERKGSPVTKQEIQNHLADNKVQINDVWKGDLKFNDKSKYALPEVIKAARQAGDTPGDLALTLANDGDAYRALTKKFPELKENEDWAEVVSNSIFGGDSIPKGTTKYRDYQLPGGENYRELLMTLPDKQKRLYKWEYFDPKTQQSKQFKTEAEAKAAAPEGAIVNQKEVAELNPSYKSSHWDEPNILAHIRMNDRTVDGAKTLHVEEIQSDWHQAGRNHGYKNPKDQEKYEAATKALEDARTELRKPENWDKDANAILDPLINAQREASASMTNGVPDAPFKKNWHELALKRALQEAVENGYDRLSWTPGEAQAARYDLSKQIDKITYNAPNSKLANRYGTVLKAYNKHGDEMINKIAKPEELSDLIGKEAADKLLKSEAKNDKHFLENADLKIGGEGMKGFYDNIIPKSIEKLGKEFGVKVQKLEKSLPKFAVYQRINKISPDFENAAEARAWGKEHGFEGKATVRESVEGNPHSLYYIDIPPAMREKILKQGQPLFATPNLTPVQHDPFKTTPIDYNPDFL